MNGAPADLLAAIGACIAANCTKCAGAGERAVVVAGGRRVFHTCSACGPLRAALIEAARAAAVAPCTAEAPCGECGECCEGGEDPIRDGWIGSDGRP